MSVLQIILFLLGGLILLVAGGEILVRGSVGLAKRFNVSPLIIGLTIVSFGTSSPELLVSVKAALSDYGSLSMGNVIGSNIGNIAIILGISALIYPISVSKQIIKKEMPILIGVTLGSILFLLDGNLTRIEGAVFFIGLIIYIVIGYKLSVKHKDEVVPSTEVETIKPMNFALAAVLIIAGLFMLVLGGDFFVKGAVEVAKRFNLSEAVIGLTIVAIGTSLPELFTSLIAAIKKEADIAIGNIIGSNIFNLLGILGLTSIIHPIKAEAINLIDFGLMFILTLFLFPLLKTGMKLNRLEGMFLISVYVGYVVYLLY
jgi:cation:H+ antiporter